MAVVINVKTAVELRAALNSYLSLVEGMAPEILTRLRGFILRLPVNSAIFTVKENGKEMSSTISSKGQITVPIEIRIRLGLKEGDRVEFVAENGRTIMRPARSPQNPFEKYIGALPAFESKEQVNNWVADLRDDED
jgi:AbrB family looped-hinge helix DNA binding protein